MLEPDVYIFYITRIKYSRAAYCSHKFNYNCLILAFKRKVQIKNTKT